MGSTGVTTVEAEAGEPVRVRVINTDNGPLRAWVSGSDFRVVAVDGTRRPRADRRGPTSACS